jgi:hypothetical protein
MSEYHFFDRQKFKGKILRGGLFLSAKEVPEIPDHTIIFYDQSQQLKKTLEQLQKNLKKKFTLVEVTTSKINPFQVHQLALGHLQPLLTKCEIPLKHLQQKVTTIKDKLLKQPPFKKQILFFLGRIGKGVRLPPLIVGKDLFNLFWLEHGKIETYESDLAYAYWSEKELASKYKDAIRVGLFDGKNRSKKYYFVKNQSYNLKGPGVLIPGLSQIFFMQDFIKFYDKELSNPKAIKKKVKK